MRPLLVLLLVAAAVGAFFFAMNIGEDSVEAPPTVSGPGREPTVVQAPTQEEDIPPLAVQPGRIEEPVRNATNRTVAEVTDAVKGNAIRGRVVMPDGKTPVKDAQVTLTVYDMFSFIGAPADRGKDRTFTTSDTGVFTFTDVEPFTEYSLIAAHPAHGRRVENHVQVSDGEKKDGVVIVLQPGARLFGRVSDTAGNAVVGAELYLGMAALGNLSDDPTAVRATSDGTGHYEFKNVSDGNYSLEVAAEGYGRVSLPQVNVAGKDDHEQDVELEIAHMIAGTVKNMQSLPVEGAVVQAWSSDSAPGKGQRTRTEAKSNEKGEFLLDDVRAGTYTLFVIADGYKNDRVMRVETGDMSVQIQLSPLPRVFGQVFDDAGAPLRNFTVSLRVPVQNTEDTIALPEPKIEVRGADNGEFELACPNPGEYVVEVQAKPFAPSFSDRFTVGEGAEVSGLVVRMNRGGTITGRLVDYQGNPVAGARIQTHDSEYVDDAFFRSLGEYPSAATKATATSGADGTFRIDGLAPETYQVDIRHKTFAQMIRTDIVVNLGQIADVGNLRLTSGATVRGTVLGPNGSPLPGATVQLRSDGEEAHSYTARTDVNGGYEVGHVPAGSYMIFAQRPPDPNNPFRGANDQKKTQRTVSISEGQTYTEDFSISG